MHSMCLTIEKQRQTEYEISAFRTILAYFHWRPHNLEAIMTWLCIFAINKWALCSSHTAMRQFPCHTAPQTALPDGPANRNGSWICNKVNCHARQPCHQAAFGRYDANHSDWHSDAARRIQCRIPNGCLSVSKNAGAQSTGANGVKLCKFGGKCILSAYDAFRQQLKSNCSLALAWIATEMIWKCTATYKQY